MVNLGFTGTRDGMTLAQRKQIAMWMAGHYQDVEQLHHGGCVGADYQMHTIACWYRIPTTIHWPVDLSYAMSLDETDPFSDGSIEERDELPYIDRNHNIVDECDLLIATPKEMKEIQRSGTWATIRYAYQMAKSVIIFRPT